MKSLDPWILHLKTDVEKPHNEMAAWLIDFLGSFHQSLRRLIWVVSRMAMHFANHLKKEAVPLRHHLEETLRKYRRKELWVVSSPGLEKTLCAKEGVSRVIQEIIEGCES